MTASQVKFRPWVGKYYRNRGWHGRRLLVLGESHYSRSKAANRDRRLTQRWVRSCLSGDDGSSFFTLVAELVHGRRDIDDASWCRAWDSIAFYNYVQSVVIPGPRVPPTEQQWAAAQRPFIAVLQSLRPDGILVLGKRLWSRLPDGPERVADDGRGMKSKTPIARYSCGARHVAIAVGLKHPKAYGVKLPDQFMRCRVLRRQILRAGRSSARKKEAA